MEDSRNTMKHAARWKALVFVCIYMLAFAVTFQSIPPVFSFIVSSFAISHTQAGALMSLFALPGIFISIPGGILTDVYGPRRVGLAALTIALAGTLLVGLGNSFSLLLAGRIIAGTGALTMSVVAPQILSRWFIGGELGKAMGFFNTMMPLGTILTLNLFGRLAAVSNWRIPILLTAAYSLFVLLLFFLKYPALPGEEEPKSREKPALKQEIYAVLKTGWPIWLLSAVWMMYNASTISFLTFGGDYYISAGYNAGYAGFLTSLLMIGSLLFSPLTGHLTDRIGKAEYFIATGSVIIAVMFFLVPRTEIHPLLLGSLIGFFAALIPAPVFFLVPKVLPPAQVGLGYGILGTCLNVGILLGPLLIGFSYDQTFSYLPGFNFIALFALLTGAFALILRLVKQARTRQGVEIYK
jgi:predicted MFS family arabinose efflux permease